jgi:hypothetical protein
MTIRAILRPLEIFYGHLVYFVVIWYIFPGFGILNQEKSGNPAGDKKQANSGTKTASKRHFFQETRLTSKKTNSNFFRHELFWPVFELQNERKASGDQGCQMVYFQTKNHNFGTFRRTLDR